MTSSALSSTDVLKLFQQYVIPNYGRYGIALTRGNTFPGHGLGKSGISIDSVGQGSHSGQILR